MPKISDHGVLPDDGVATTVGTGATSQVQGSSTSRRRLKQLTLVPTPGGACLVI